jgi:NitT/TauT family transport system ATP-binding protein
MSEARLRIGYIPLVDAAALLVAVDHGFAAAEGLDVELVREVSWSNVRDKLNIGLFDAAHMLAPLPIASSLGIGHVRVPLIAPFNLALNGNAITVTPALHAELAALADGDPSDPLVSARALARVVANRKTKGASPLNFGMTFPFSNHNYQLRYWMAAGGVDPDEDVRMVVLPPPYMVESLTNGHIDGFCVGAPWNSVAVESGVGCIQHFGSELMVRLPEKMLVVRQDWADSRPVVLAALIRALAKAADHIEAIEHRAEVTAMIASRLEVEPSLVSRTLNGVLKVAPDGTMRSNDRYIVVGRENASRPDPAHAAWFYAQMVRWGQTPLSEEANAIAQSVFRPDLYDVALGRPAPTNDGGPRDGIGAFTGPDFVPADIGGYLKAWDLKRSGGPRLSIVR